jgi:hypothetical protein
MYQREKKLDSLYHLALSQSSCVDIKKVSLPDLNGRVYMMTCGSPDHSIIASNLNGLLQAFLRGRRSIVYTSDV